MQYITMSWNSSVTTVADYRMDDQGLFPSRQGHVSLSHYPDQLWGTPCLLSGGYREVFPKGKEVRV